jgi:hypothetical protein
MLQKCQLQSVDYGVYLMYNYPCALECKNMVMVIDVLLLLEEINCR